MKRLALLAGLAAVALAGIASAAPKPPIKFLYANPQAFIAQGAIVPAGSEIFFVSGFPISRLESLRQMRTRLNKPATSDAASATLGRPSSR